MLYRYIHVFPLRISPKSVLVQVTPEDILQQFSSRRKTKLNMRTHAHTSLKRSSRSEASPCQFSTIMEGVGLAAVRRMSSITHALRLVF